MGFVWHGLQMYHPFSTFGPANTVTAFRAMMTSSLAGLLPVAATLYSSDSQSWMWFITVLAAVSVVLDGLDGYLARRSGLQSAFGARFDMEIDALLALIIALFLWQSQKTGLWVLGLGVMRYAFVIASFKISALQASLYPSIRRKTVCVLQLSALCAMLSPWMKEPYTTLIGILALTCLAGSFMRDILWLLNQDRLDKLASRLNGSQNDARSEKPEEREDPVNNPVAISTHKQRLWPHLLPKSSR